ncbi:MAG: 23S rRNA (uracil(1939)-C(5))-methyltransferase RlmD [Gammaproteobacteria bacterium]|nr:MAG: 23S rRNA (uracil(1939)-C(5))-methyltransferase RlmD [Gammaproteobacteria bacterium]
MASRRRRNRPSEPREVTIESMSHEGRGIAHVNGKTVFVFGALPGERVLMQVQQRSRKFDQAVTLEVIEASPQRIEPRCEFFQVCGGCSLQHLSNDDQVALKQQSLLDMMAHAGVRVGQVLAPLRGPEWGYRKKARLGVKNVTKKGRVLVGFRERSTPFIADMRACEVLLPEVGNRLQELSELVGQLDARAQIPQIEVAADDSQVQLVFRHLQPLSESDLGLLREFARQHGFLLQLQPAGPETVHDLYPAEQSLAFDPIGDGSIAIGFNALDFVQVNTTINQQMVRQALEFLELQATDSVLDLFCGLGNFTLPVARRCARVSGIEGDAAMVQRARESAQANGIGNTEYYVADLGSPDANDPWARADYDKILLDPPRSGAQEMARSIGSFKARRIVYVSCQPSSLVRDAAIICGQGYQMTHLGVMDMFPQTAHIESMAVFAK